MQETPSILAREERAAPDAGSKTPPNTVSSAPQVRKLLSYVLTASLLAIPCFWQTHIQGTDLPSHLYNAWIANQVSAGQLPGLFLVPQFTNVFFDHLLSLLLRTGSVYLAEHLAALVVVL